MYFSCVLDGKCFNKFVILSLLNSKSKFKRYEMNENTEIIIIIFGRCHMNELT